MAILIKPAKIDRDLLTEFTLNKQELAELAVVSEDSFFNDIDNWKSVSIFYRSDIGSQNSIVKFDATKSEPKSNFLATFNARDAFEVTKITIEDFDGGKLEIYSQNLPLEQLNVTLPEYMFHEDDDAIMLEDGDKLLTNL
jgi:hypothetical protein